MLELLADGVRAKLLKIDYYTRSNDMRGLDRRHFHIRGNFMGSDFDISLTMSRTPGVDPSLFERMPFKSCPGCGYPASAHNGNQCP